MTITGTIECKCGAALPYELGYKFELDKSVTPDRSPRPYKTEYLKTHKVLCLRCLSLHTLEKVVGGGVEICSTDDRWVKKIATEVS